MYIQYKRWSFCATSCQRSVFESVLTYSLFLIIIDGAQQRIRSVEILANVLLLTPLYNCNCDNCYICINKIQCSNNIMSKDSNGSKWSIRSFASIIKLTVLWELGHIKSSVKQNVVAWKIGHMKNIKCLSICLKYYWMIHQFYNPSLWLCWLYFNELRIFL